MSSAMSPAEALSRIPGWDGSAVACTELNGGLTNRTHLVEREGQKCILRLDAEHTYLYGLNRRRERSILVQAVDSGLAPEVIFFDVDAGILVTAFIPGRSWEVSDLDDYANIEALSALLREVHALPTCGSDFDAGRVARRYVDNLTAHDRLHAFGVRCQEIIESIDESGVSCCCHNDLVVENVICASRLMLIDWEYACDNDPLFDLASLISYHDLSDRKAQALLSAYAGGTDPAMKELLDEQVRLYDSILWLWLANWHTITRTSHQVTRMEELQRRIK